MRGTCIAAATILGLIGEFPIERSHVTLLTVAQRDRIRSRSSPASASISADGRYVAFSSYEQLTPEDDDSLADIYVLDSTAGEVALESMTVEGSTVRADCIYPRISGDGRYLVFESAVSAEHGPLAYADVVFRDRVANVTRRISRSESGGLADGWTGGAAISDDGSTVVFESSATNLVPGIDANGVRSDVYLVHTSTGRIRRVSLDTRGVQSPEGASMAPSMSGDGRYVAFVSSAALTSAVDSPILDRTSNGSRLQYHIYVRDTQLNVTTRINATDGASASNDSTFRPSISRDGAYVAFASAATNLVPGDQNRSPDVFLYEVRTGSITLVSRSRTGRPANGPSGNPSISADGRFVAFQSEASDLVCSRRCSSSEEDINLLSDVFLFDRVTGLITWVSTGRTGSGMEESAAPVLDAAGRVLAFTSRHPIDARDTGHDFDLFVRIASATPSE